jgi:molybdopterin synthase sulfur carrier subunit
VARIRLYGPARDAAGCANDDVEGATVAAVLEVAVARYGETFAEVLRVSRIWVNGDVADLDRAVGPQDEVAVLPPVSGGC